MQLTFSIVIGEQDDTAILQKDDEDDGPNNQRCGSQDVILRWEPMEGLQLYKNVVEDIQRRCANVSIHNAEGPTVWVQLTLQELKTFETTRD